jgi:hypothetical protein
MHHPYPDQQVHPYPHSMGHQQQAETLATDGSDQHHDGSTSLSDDYDLDVGLAGALQ